MVALASEQRSALFTALMRLSDEDRLVVGYRYFFDLSEAEMAEALGVARGTVKSRLARALGRLRTTFGEVYPLVILAPDLAASMREGLVDLAAHLPRPPVRDLTNGVLESIRAGEGAGRRPTSSAPASMLGPLGLAALAAALLVIAVLAPWRLASRPSPLTASPAGQKVVAYGGGLTVAERQEVTQLLGTTEGYAEVQTVTGEELVATLQAAGLPVAPGDEAISSAALTCGEAGQGLRVSTRHITRIPAAEYALALLTATPIDASLVIAAPSTKPVTGEAALVGALKVASQCEAERETDPARVRLAYEQLKIVTALAGEVGDWSKASALMLRAAQDVIAGRATDEASIGAALERAAAADGLTISAAQRAEVISLLSQLSNLEYGPYTKGYVIRANSPDEIDVTPARDAR
jgi:uncharacterized protein YpuA (DUF1002 family)